MAKDDESNVTKAAARAAMKNRRRSPTESSINVISPMNSHLKKETKGSTNSQVEVAELALQYVPLKENFMEDAANLSEMKQQL